MTDMHKRSKILVKPMSYLYGKMIIFAYGIVLLAKNENQEACIMNRMLKKAVSLVVAAAVVVSGVAATGTKASAKTKTYTAKLMYCGEDWNNSSMDDSIKSVGTTKVTGKKGSKTYTCTIKKSQLMNNKGAIKYAKVFCVDLQDMLKDYKVSDIKISGVKVTVDGKAVSGVKGYKSGNFEPGNKHYRLSLYNEVGTDGDNTRNLKSKYGKKFAFKKSLSISFTVTLKK